MAQRAWAIVNSRGYIDQSSLKYCRKDAIAAELVEWRKYTWGLRNAHLTDAQFWRKLKANRGYSCRRVTLRVSR